LVLPKKLFEWLEEQYEPIKKFLPTKAQRNFKHLTCSSASVGYQIICEQAGLEYAWEDNPKPNKFFGGTRNFWIGKKNIKEILYLIWSW